MNLRIASGYALIVMNWGGEIMQGTEIILESIYFDDN